MNCSSSKETLIADLDNEVVQIMYWSLISNRIDVFEKTKNEKYRNSLLQVYINGNADNQISILILDKTENELEKTQSIYFKDKNPFLIVETESELENNPLEPVIRKIKYYVSDWNKSNFIVLTNEKNMTETKMESKKIELELLIELAERYKTE